MRADKRDGAPTTHPSITHPLTEAGNPGRERPPKTSAADSSIDGERNGAFDVRRKIRRANARQLGETLDVTALLLRDVRRSISRRTRHVRRTRGAGRTDANSCTYSVFVGGSQAVDRTDDWCKVSLTMSKFGVALYNAAVRNHRPFVSARGTGILRVIVPS